MEPEMSSGKSHDEQIAASSHDYDGRHDAARGSLEAGNDPAVEAAASASDVPTQAGGHAARPNVPDPVAPAASAATTPDFDAILALFQPEPYRGLKGKLVCEQCQGSGEVPGRNYDDPRWMQCLTCGGDGLAAPARAALGRTR